MLVATRGDDAFLAFDGRRGWHFPRDRDGKYAGYYPADSEAAIAHLEELRAQGATHLVLPRTAFWWLDHYEGLHEHLDAAYRQDPQRRGRDRLRPHRRGSGSPTECAASEPAATTISEVDASELYRRAAADRARRRLALPQRRRRPDGRSCSASTWLASRTRPSTSPPPSLAAEISRSTSAGSRSATSPRAESSDR